MLIWCTKKTLNFHFKDPSSFNTLESLLLPAGTLGWTRLLSMGTQASCHDCNAFRGYKNVFSSLKSEERERMFRLKKMF